MSANSPTRTRKGPKLWIAFAFVLLILAGGTVVILAFRVPARPASPPLPDPNGYDDVLRAARSILRSDVKFVEVEVTTANPSELRRVVEPNREALSVAREGLRKPFQVPFEYRMSAMSRSISEMSQLRAVARMFYAEGRLAEADGRTDEALSAYLDDVRLGHAIRRKTPMLLYLTGLAIESLGIAGIRNLRDDLDPSQLQRAIETIESLEGKAEPIDAVVSRELAYMDANVRDQGIVARTAMSLSGMIATEKAQAATQLRSAAMRHQTQRRLLLADLAIQRHIQEHGRPPDRLAELAPEVLSAVPKDPYTGRSLIYRKTDDGYRLYSVGPDGRDDRLTRVLPKNHRDTARGDFTLESF